MVLYKDRIKALQQLSRRLLLQEGEETEIYVGDWGRLNRETSRLIASLFSKKGKTLEEEAEICLALLMGYAACIYITGRETKIQTVLNRCWKILDKLTPSLLKCRLLVFCYGETYAEELATEAHTISDSWDRQNLTAEQQEIIGYLKEM